jgi:hypothetical protein
MTERETVCQALLTLGAAAYSWNNTPSRRLLTYEDVPSATRPALFQHEFGSDTYTWGQKPFPKRAFTVQWWAYFDSSADSPGAPTINAIIAALEAALAPSGAALTQTLSGNCYDARIKSVMLRDPGDIDGTGLVIIEIEIIIP